jgi:3-phosphoglycerate kinase
MKQTVYDLSAKGKKVYIRVDYNVPMNEKGGILDDRRIRATLPTLEFLLKQGASLILASHMGRPKGSFVPSLSLRPAAERLSALIGRPVKMAPDCIGDETDRMKEELQAGDILMLENLRFHSGEEKNDPAFAEALIRGCGLAVNDAFGVSHRAHASIVGVGRIMPMAAGLLLKKEMDFLGAAMDQPERPFAAVIGGAKISDKIHVIANLMEKADVILIGGGMANTFVAAGGYDMGSSLLDRDRLDLARDLMKRAEKMGVRMLLPVDFVAADQFSEKAKVRIFQAKDFSDPWMALDIGPKTIKIYVETLKKMKTIVWNGPMGVFEMKPFSKGTYAIAEAMASIQAVTIIGGGESAAVVDQLHLADRFTHVSTGGGASLEMLEGMILPGISVLAEKRDDAQ